MAKIYLIGYMGSGKSTAGQKLATKLNYQFIDLDRFIESEYGKTIPQIFAEKGESEFRAFENNVLKKIITMDNIVVACGGGTPCFYNNIELMNNTGITVYIKMSVDVLMSRLKAAKEERPLIKNKTEDELRKFISRQLEIREDFYHKAQYLVKGKDLKVDELVTFIKDQIETKVGQP
jgi:shikimate kinase